MIFLLNLYAIESYDLKLSKTKRGNYLQILTNKFTISDIDDKCIIIYLLNCVKILHSDQVNSLKKRNENCIPTKAVGIY